MQLTDDEAREITTLFRECFETADDVLDFSAASTAVSVVGKINSRSRDTAVRTLIHHSHSHELLGRVLLDLAGSYPAKKDRSLGFAAIIETKYKAANAEFQRKMKQQVGDAQEVGLDQNRDDFLQRATSLNALIDLKTLGNWIGDAEKRICRVRCDGDDYGTGFLISDQLVLTCYHVIETCIPKQKRKYLSVSFDNGSDGEEGKHEVVKVDPQWDIPFATHSERDEKDFALDPEPEKLDFAILKLSKAVSDRGHFLLSEDVPLPEIGEPTLMAGHPGPNRPLQPLRFSMAAPGFDGTNDNGTRLIYKHSSEKGSSGSPVVDRKCRLFGLHHNRGEKEGSFFRNNRGIPIARIIDALMKSEWANVEEVADLLKTKLAAVSRESVVDSEPQYDPSISIPVRAPSEDAVIRDYLLGLIDQLQASFDFGCYVELTGVSARRIPRHFGNRGFGPSTNSHRMDGRARDPGFLDRGPRDGADSEGAEGDQEGRSFSANTVRLDRVDEAIERFNGRFVIQGDPGAGKTVALANLARTAAKKLLSGGERHPLPMFVHLSTWTDDVEVDELIARTLPEAVRDVLQAVRRPVSLYFDGLDEIGLKGEEKAVRLREWLAANRVPAVVTCRTENYVGDLRVGLPYVTLRRLNDEQIEQFAQAYLDDGAEAFLKSLKENYDHGEPYVDEIKRNPFKLSGLIEIEYLGGLFPRHETELVPALVRAVWQREKKRWSSDEARSDSVWPKFDKMIARFSRVAFAMTEENRVMQVPSEWAIQYMAGCPFTEEVSTNDRAEIQQLLSIAQQARLVKTVGQNLHFEHRLIQDYFAAEGLKRASSWGILEVERDAAGGYFNAEPVDEGRMILSYGRYLGKWDQVVTALCGLLRIEKEEDDAPASSIVQHVLGIDPRLAAICLGTGAKVSKAVESDVINRLVRALKSPAKADHAWTGAAFQPTDFEQLDFVAQRLADSYVGADSEKSEKVVADLLQQMPSQDEWIRRKAGEALSVLGERAVPTLIDALSHLDARVRSTAGQALIDMGEPAMMPLVAHVSGSRVSYRLEKIHVLDVFGQSYPEAIRKRLEEVRSKATGTAEELANIALLEFAAGQKQEAVRILGEASKLRSDWADYHLLIGHLHELSDMASDAVSSFRRAVELEPRSADANIRMLSATQANGAEAAQSELLDAYEARCEDGTFADEALSNQQLTEIAELHATLAPMLGEGARRDEAYVRAIEACERAIQRAAGDVNAYFSLADVHRKAQRDDLGLSAYKRALQANPEDHWFMNSLGELLVDFGEYDAAAKLHLRATELAPTDAESYMGLCWALQHTDPPDLRTAFTAAMIALRLMPDEPWIKKELANIYRYAGETEEAKRVYRSTLAGLLETPNSQESTMGWCHFCLGEFDKAVEVYRAVLAHDESHVSDQFDLALALLCDGRESEADAAYREGLARVAGKHALEQRGPLVIATFDLRQVQSNPLEPLAGIDGIVASLQQALRESQAAFRLDLDFVDDFVGPNAESDT